MPLKISGKISDADKHDYDVNTLVYHKGFLYSGADDGKIIKWDNDLKKVGEVAAHQSSIYSICAMENTIYSCSNDGTIKSWTLDLTDKATLITAECEFWKIVASDGVLYSGDDKGMMLTFKDDFVKGTYELLEPIKDMKVEENRLYMSKDSDVIIVTIGQGDKNTFANRKIIPGRAPLHLAGDKLAFIDRASKGIVLHENSNESNYKEVAKVENAHEMVILALTGLKKGGDIHLYTGGWDKVIKEWKFPSSGGKLEQVDSCDMGIVINVLYVSDDGILYAAGGDGMVIKCEI